MEPDLIDRYLDELQRSLARSRRMQDVLAEVEDHLRESVGRLTQQGVDGGTAQRLTLDRFGDHTVVARAFSTNAGGLAMTTTFTRTAGAVAYAAVVLWLLTAAAAAFDQFVGPPSDTRMYAVVSVLAALATAATAIVVAGILVRTGGLGDGDAWSVVALVLMVLATFMMAAAPWAWALTAIPLTGAAIITVWRMRSVGLGRPWSDWSLILAWPAGVLVFIVGELIRVGPQDFYGNYPYAFQAGLTLAVVAYSAGLIGVGRRLRSEQAVGAPTMAGIPA